MENRAQRIQNILTQSLAPVEILLEDETHRHHVPKGSETHFKLTIVSSKFENTTRVKRHQVIYHLLQQELNAGLHALSIRALTPTEWLSHQDTSHITPNCKGGFDKL